MVNVLIWVDAEQVGSSDFYSASSGFARGIAVLKQAIAASHPDATIHLLSSGMALPDRVGLEEVIVCPLTLDLPASLEFPARPLYQRCRQVDELRQWVTQTLSYPSQAGQLWLPIILTARGPVYGEVIGQSEKTDSGYIQPLHLPDRWRQPLYRMAKQVLWSLSAPPAVYLLQFDIQADTVYFDRLFPFPFHPAIASIGIQEPDLFTCHWLCQTHQSILDLRIQQPALYQVYQGNEEQIPTVS